MSLMEDAVRGTFSTTEPFLFIISQNLHGSPVVINSYNRFSWKYPNNGEKMALYIREGTRRMG